MTRPRNAPYLCALLLLFLTCCKKPFNPRVAASPASYLVVEGVINSGNDSTIFTLSKTVNTNTKTTANPVLEALVVVESDAGASWQLIGDGRGRYVSGPLNLPASRDYRVRITTDNGLVYLSDFVPVVPTPPIDSVGYFIKNASVQPYVSTHDAANKTRYYRWDYNETWQFHAKYGSLLMVDSVNYQLVLRPPDKQIFSCFGNDVSHYLLLASTTRLSSDIVNQNFLTSIPLSSEKLETKYSMLVKQYALTADAFQFYTVLKKNTEELGGIFGVLPSVLTGNIHCISNTAIPVIGYITATNVQSKRIFILNRDLPPALTIYPYDCEVDTASTADVLLRPPYVYIPISATLKGYLFSSRECADCTLRGTTQTPSFWR